MVALLTHCCCSRWVSFTVRVQFYFKISSIFFRSSYSSGYSFELGYNCLAPFSSSSLLIATFPDYDYFDFNAVSPFSLPFQLSNSYIERFIIGRHYKNSDVLYDFSNNILSIFPDSQFVFRSVIDSLNNKIFSYLSDNLFPVLSTLQGYPSLPPPNYSSHEFNTIIVPSISFVKGKILDCSYNLNYSLELDVNDIIRSLRFDSFDENSYFDNFGA